MTDAALPAGRFAEGEFRVGGVLNRTWSVLSRNFLTFFLVTAIANLPDLLLTNPGQDRGLFIAAALVSEVLGRVSQAMVVYGAFQQMRGKPASLVASVQAGWRRILPVRAAGAVLVIATYHDLRVAKEGVDTAQIAAVFE
jgi:hypothetical protein